MVHWTARVVTVRTTCDNAGRACDVITGMGGTPELALPALHAKAEEAAQQLAEKMARESPHSGLLALILEKDSPASKAYSKSWQFEIIDVRFTPGPIESGGSGWLVYGTLTRKEEPEQKSAGSIQQ